MVSSLHSGVIAVFVAPLCVQANLNFTAASRMSLIPCESRPTNKFNYYFRLVRSLLVVNK